MRDSQPAAVISRYKAAYKHANGREPVVTFLRGYYTIMGSRYRLTEVLKMTTTLLGRQSYLDRHYL
jgi:hypothetical protein